MFKIIPHDASVKTPADLPAVATSPSWTARQLVAMTLVLGLLAAAALLVDLPLARYFQNDELPGELRRLVRLAESFGWGGTVALLIVTAVVLDRRGWRVVPRLAIGAYGAGLVADGAKLLVARLRPAGANLEGHVRDTFIAWLPLAHAESLGQDYGYKLQSFPSGHAATAAGLAVALAALYPRGRWLFVAFAVLTGLQRIDAQAHFASDVLSGAALGCLVGAVCQFAWPSACKRLE